MRCAVSAVATVWAPRTISVRAIAFSPRSGRYLYPDCIHMVNR